MKDQNRTPRGPKRPVRQPAAKPEAGALPKQNGTPSGTDLPRRTPVYDFSCPVQARCGGCQMSGMPYREQLKRKQKRVEELLGGFCRVETIRGMEKPYHYRNKVHAVLGTDKKGLPVSGVYAYGTHRLVPVKRCLL